MTCKIGAGLTAESKFLVRKSKKNFGQKKPSIAPASWSRKSCQSRRKDLKTILVNIQQADVSIMRRAQWFLINLPMLLRGATSRPASSVRMDMSCNSYDVRKG